MKVWISRRMSYFVDILSGVGDKFLPSCSQVFFLLNIRFRDIFKSHKSSIKKWEYIYTHTRVCVFWLCRSKSNPPNWILNYLYMKEVPSHLTRLYTTIFEAIILLQTPAKYNIIRIGKKKKKGWNFFIFPPAIQWRINQLNFVD